MSYRRWNRCRMKKERLRFARIDPESEAIRKRLKIPRKKVFLKILKNFLNDLGGGTTPLAVRNAKQTQRLKEARRPLAGRRGNCRTESGCDGVWHDGCGPNQKSVSEI